jgi:hypothetical protein
MQQKSFLNGNAGHPFRKQSKAVNETWCKNMSLQSEQDLSLILTGLEMT